MPADDLDDLDRMSGEWCRALFERNPQPMWIYEQKTLKFLAVNGAAAKHYGYSPEEFRSMTIEDLRPPDEVPRLAHRDKQNLSPGFHSMGVWAHLTKEGARILVEISKYPLKFKGRKAVCVLANDVTEHEQALAAQRRMAAVIESTSDFVAFVTLDNQLDYINNAGRALIGLDSRELGRLTLAELQGGTTDKGLKEAARTGLWRGEAKLFRRDGHAIPVSQVIIGHRGTGLTFYSTIARDMTEQKEAERRIAFLASHDPLTGLPNRAVLYDRLEHALAHARRNQLRVAVFYLDLDGFKQVNDIYGHAKEDAVLRKVAARLAGAVRKDDTVARVGGDEFTVIVEGMREIERVTAIAQAIIETVSLRVRGNGRDLKVTVSMGISLYPEHGEDMETLLKQADSAMYVSKRSGGRQYCMADKEGKADANAL